MEERGRERERDVQSELEREGEGGKGGWGGERSPKPMRSSLYSHYIRGAPNEEELAGSSRGGGDANQSINFKLYLRDQPGDLGAGRVSRSAIVDLITSRGLCARQRERERGEKERRERETRGKPRFKSGLF